MKDESKLFQYKVDTVLASGMGTTNYIEENIQGYSYLVIVKLLPSGFYESHYTPNDPDNLQDENGRWHEAGIDNYR